MTYVIGQPAMDVVDRAHTPLASPGGAAKLGRVGVDPTLLAGYPPPAR